MAFSDKDGKLYVVTVADGAEVEVADEIWGRRHRLRVVARRRLPGVQPQQRSPAWLALHLERRWWRAAPGHLGSLRRLCACLGHRRQLSVLRLGRQFAPQISNLEWNFAGNQRDGIFALALRKDVKPLSRPRATRWSLEEETADEAEEKKDDKKRQEGRQGRRRREDEEARRHRLRGSRRPRDAGAGRGRELHRARRRSRGSCFTAPRDRPSTAAPTPRPASCRSIASKTARPRSSSKSGLRAGRSRPTARRCWCAKKGFKLNDAKPKAGEPRRSRPAA